MTLPALNLLIPSSVSSTSGTATVSATGKVAFVSADYISVNGVFDSSYLNYRVIMQLNNGTATNVRMHLRASGSDNTASTYATQYWGIDGTSESAGRVTSQNHMYLYNRNIWGNGLMLTFIGPNITGSTTLHVSNAASSGNAMIQGCVSYHNTSFAADGFTIYSDAGSITGMLTVYGMAD